MMTIKKIPLLILLCLTWNLPSRTAAITRHKNHLIDISFKLISYQPADTIKWKLIFEDNFNSNGSFDTLKWSYAQRWNPAWAKYLTADPQYVRQESGNLLLRMDKQVIKNDPVPYHSGGIQTAKKFNFQYGKVEVRARFNQGKGSWPAIWMMPDTPIAYGDWPNSGEIDIMEHVNKEDIVHQTIHNRTVTSTDGGSTATQKSTYNAHDFNTYSIIWDATKIEFYVNNNLRYTYYKPIPSTAAQWPFDKPFYLILNQSGGAGWPGSIDDADLPFQMEVDYIHVYQKQETQTK